MELNAVSELALRGIKKPEAECLSARWWRAAMGTGSTCSWLRLPTWSSSSLSKGGFCYTRFACSAPTENTAEPSLQPLLLSLSAARVAVQLVEVDADSEPNSIVVRIFFLPAVLLRHLAWAGLGAIVVGPVTLVPVVHVFGVEAAVFCNWTVRSGPLGLWLRGCFLTEFPSATLLASCGTGCTCCTAPDWQLSLAPN